MVGTLFGALTPRVQVSAIVDPLRAADYVASTRVLLASALGCRIARITVSAAAASSSSMAVTWTVTAATRESDESIVSIMIDVDRAISGLAVVVSHSAVITGTCGNSLCESGEVCSGNGRTCCPTDCPIPMNGARGSVCMVASS